MTPKLHPGPIVSADNNTLSEPACERMKTKLVCTFRCTSGRLRPFVVSGRENDRMRCVALIVQTIEL